MATKATGSITQEPTVSVRVNDKPVTLMPDSGACFTVVQPKDATHLPMSGHYIRTIGFCGSKQLIPTTQPVTLQLQSQTAVLPILVSDKTPIGLLGRDALTRLNCTIKCTPEGCILEVPEEMYPQYAISARPEGPLVYWLGGLSDDFMEPARQWDRFIAANLPGSRLPDYAPHCTLQYLKEASDEEAAVWRGQQPPQIQISASCIIIGPQGAALKINSQPYLDQNFKVENSAPHVTLRIASDHQQRQGQRWPNG